MPHTTLMAALALILIPGLAGAVPQSPAGTWRTVDDEDGRESGSVTIVERDGMLSGTVTAIADPAKAGATCLACTGDRRGKPLLGLQVISGMKPDGAEWSGGEILDPKTGRTYRCSMRLEAGGQTLRVRGYVGIAALGRTQVWSRR